MDVYGLNVKGNIITENVTELEINNEVNTGIVALKADDSVGASQYLVKADADGGGVELYFDGVLIATTSNDGLNGNVEDFEIGNTFDGGTVSLKADDVYGTSRYVLKGNPDGAVDLYYDGALVAQTTALGITGALWG